MDLIFSLVFGILSKWYIWLPVVLVLGYLTYRNNKHAKTLLEMEHRLLVLEIPRTNDKQALAAEQMFASLHGILRSKRELTAKGELQEHISFEIAAINKQIRFYVWVPKHLQNFVEGQIYAQYPTVQIHTAEEDYATRMLSHQVQYSSEMSLAANEALPIKTFQSFEVDPLAAITASLAKLEDADEEMWIQVLARPVADDWHKKSNNFISGLKSGKRGSAASGFGKILLQSIAALSQPPAQDSKPQEISERDKGRIAEVEKKSIKLGYQVKVRIVYLGNDATTAKLRMQAIIGTFKQFNSTNLNSFVQKNASYSLDSVAQYRSRFFIDRGYTLNIEELASLYHLPHTNVETPNIVWASSKTAEPPAKLPVITGTAADSEISAFGLTNFRGNNLQFGINRSDRGRHVYVVGQTGTGKSGLLELFALSDIFHNEGYAIIDPHGDFAINNIRYIPASRIKDVVYFNPADTAFPMGFNPMEVTNPALKNNTCSEIIGVLKRMFGDSWGPRLEYILRYTILALLDYPDTTMLDITRMLTDKKFRKDVLAKVQDAVVLNFWNVEFASWNDKFLAEAISPVLNKVGAFTANPIIRNIIGQPKSTFNVRQMMDEGKILIVNLSKGLVGEDNAAILGAFLVIKIQLAAMSRSDIPRVEDRRPFYLYVDEFQNFATDSFATILSEARKYGLNLTVANQYVSQMQETVRDAVFGNVGTMITFRISPDDSTILAKPFAPQFEPDDLLQMHNRHFIISMIIKGEKAPAYSATTLTLPQNQTDFSKEIVENTRRIYAKTRQEVEAAIDLSVRAVIEAVQTPQQIRATQHNNNYPPRQQGSGGYSQQRPRAQGNNYSSDQQNRPRPSYANQAPRDNDRPVDGGYGNDSVARQRQPYGNNQQPRNNNSQPSSIGDQNRVENRGNNPQTTDDRSGSNIPRVAQERLNNQQPNERDDANRRPRTRSNNNRNRNNNNGPRSEQSPQNNDPSPRHDNQPNNNRERRPNPNNRVGQSQNQNNASQQTQEIAPRNTTDSAITEVRLR